MGRPKRNASQADAAALEPPAKKGRKEKKAAPAAGRLEHTSAAETPAFVTKEYLKDISTTAAAGRLSHASVKKAEDPVSVSHDAKRVVKGKESLVVTAHESTLAKVPKVSKASKATKPAVESAPAPKASKAGANQGKKRGKEASDHKVVYDAEGEGTQQHYWLMKAEPESRMEKGKDVKFSIDDLAARTEPEAWDGVRNLAARNNIRAMMKGDLAFFYHSNCKVPGIAGIMEIVQEYAVDESAFDEDHPYYDKKSDRETPKWFVVHVEFRQKFKELVKLKDLQKFSKSGGMLDNLQTLKQTRLSVSKVSQKEWDFILGLAEIEDTTAPISKSDEA